MSALLTAPLSHHHRARIEEIVRATDVFSGEEVAVALELFDEATEAGPIPRAARSTQHASENVPSGSSYVFLGAFTPDEELIGFACYGAIPGADGAFDLYWIAVHPSAQHRGVGTLLMDEVERRLQGHRARVLAIETSSRSEYDPTRQFYQARGYVETARVRDFYGAADDRVTFTKRFHAPHNGRGAASG